MSRNKKLPNPLWKVVAFILLGIFIFKIVSYLAKTFVTFPDEKIMQMSRKFFPHNH